MNPYSSITMTLTRQVPSNSQDYAELTCDVEIDWDSAYYGKNATVEDNNGCEDFKLGQRIDLTNEEALKAGEIYVNEQMNQLMEQNE